MKKVMLNTFWKMRSLTIQFSTSTFILNASGSTSPIEGSEVQFEFLHTLISAGESAQKIFDRPMGGSWNYTQGVYAFGEVAFPSR